MLDTLNYFPFFIGDYYKNTMGLSPGERGHYIDLICAYIQNNGILKDDERLFILTRCSSCKEKEEVQQVLKLVFKKKGGYLVSEPLNILINKQKDLIEKKRKAGRISAEKRKQNQQPLQQYHNHNHNHTHSHNQEKNNKKEKNLYSDDFEFFWKSYPSKPRPKGTKKLAHAKFLKALQTTTLENLIQGVQKYATYIKASGEYNADASTWLNQERWDNEYAVNENRTPQNKHQKARTALGLNQGQPEISAKLVGNTVNLF